MSEESLRLTDASTDELLQTARDYRHDPAVPGDKGLVVQVASYQGVHTVWRMAPPLTMTYDELDRGIAMMHEAITEVTGL